MDTNCNAGFALMADLNPGESTSGYYGPDCVVSYSGLYGGAGPQTPTDPAPLQALANSNNHEKKGQNVMYADGRVEWHSTAFAGYNQDNIYTYAATGPSCYGAEQPMDEHVPDLRAEPK